MTDDALREAAHNAFWEGAHGLPDRTKRKLSVRELREIAQAVIPRILAARGDAPFTVSPDAMVWAGNKSAEAAIALERERCLGIAFRYTDERGRAAAVAGQIAAAIRSGEEP